LQATNGDNLLTGLSAGSHKLTIYGKSSSGYFANQNVELEIVYFSINYSSAWVTFALSISVLVAVLSLGLFVNRRRFMAGLRGKKNGFFWIGLVVTILTSLIFVPFAWKMLIFYLFPYDTRGSIDLAFFPVLFVLCGLIIVGLGLLLMVVGTKKINFPNWEPPHSAKKQANS
jgi:magnesium-transporting ATPase (P-type)